MNGAAQAIVRLQDTYKLKISSFASGNIHIPKEMRAEEKGEIYFSFVICLSLFRLRRWYNRVLMDASSFCNQIIISLVNAVFFSLFFTKVAAYSPTFSLNIYFYPSLRNADKSFCLSERHPIMDLLSNLIAISSF